MSQHKRPGKREYARRQEAAIKRSLVYAARTAEDQLAILDKRPGNSARERAFLMEAVR